MKKGTANWRSLFLFPSLPVAGFQHAPGLIPNRNDRIAELDLEDEVLSCLDVGPVSQSFAACGWSDLPHFPILVAIRRIREKDEGRHAKVFLDGKEVSPRSRQAP